MKTFQSLLNKAITQNPQKIVVSVAQDAAVLKAIFRAYSYKIISPILVGDETQIKTICSLNNIDLTGFEIIHEPDLKTASMKAVHLVHEKKADILIKGNLPTKLFLQSILDKEIGLRTKNLMSHISVFEIKGIHRLLFLTDIAFNTYPSLTEKIQIIRNAVNIAHACGVKYPKVAPLCASETVDPKMPSTIDALQLTVMSGKHPFSDCQIYGPLPIDIALDPDDITQQKVNNPIVGHADVLLFPDIDSGNITYKILVRTSKSKNGCLLAGTASPVILPSRSDSPDTKFNSLILASVLAHSTNISAE